MVNYIKQLLQNDISYEENAPLAPRSSFKIGGCADVSVYPDTLEKLKTAVLAAREAGIPYHLIGNASNVLFSDKGVRGAVIFCVGCGRVSVNGNKITAECGASLTHMSSCAMKSGLSGMEFAYGIPGSVGGAVCMNAGAYGGEMADIIIESSILDSETGEVLTVALRDHGFSYRKSILSSQTRLVLLSTTVELRSGARGEIKALMDHYMQNRITKQPLEYPSAGSVFKRPAPNIYVGKLIEDAGLKGYSIGGAQISEKHAGFIINRGDATASDVCALVEYIKKRIFELYDVELDCEIIKLGEWI